MEGVRERVSRTLDRMLEYAEVVRRVECCAGEALRSLKVRVLEVWGENPWIAEVEVPVERKTVVPPSFLRRILGHGFDVSRVVVNSRGVEVYAGLNLALSARFSRLDLFDAVWLSLIVEDWGAVASMVRDARVREAVEKLARAVEVVRAALGGELQLEPCPCPSEQAPSERIRELIVGAAEALAVEGAAAARYVSDWRIPLFEARSLYSLHGTAVSLSPRREVAVPEWLARMVEEWLGIKPPFRLERVRAAWGSIEVYVSGYEEGKERAARIDPVYEGATNPRDILLAAYFIEDEDWAQLIAEWRKLLGEVEEACRKVRAAALLCRLLA
jgi:hypothetical protein